MFRRCDEIPLSTGSRLSFKALSRHHDHLVLFSSPNKELCGRQRCVCTHRLDRANDVCSPEVASKIRFCFLTSATSLTWNNFNFVAWLISITVTSNVAANRTWFGSSTKHVKFQKVQETNCEHERANATESVRSISLQRDFKKAIRPRATRTVTLFVVQVIQLESMRFGWSIGRVSNFVEKLFLFISCVFCCFALNLLLINWFQSGLTWWQRCKRSSATNEWNSDHKRSLDNAPARWGTWRTIDF